MSAPPFSTMSQCTHELIKEDDRTKSASCQCGERIVVFCAGASCQQALEKNKEKFKCALCERFVCTSCSVLFCSRRASDSQLVCSYCERQIELEPVFFSFRVQLYHSDEDNREFASYHTCPLLFSSLADAVKELPLFFERAIYPFPAHQELLDELLMSNIDVRTALRKHTEMRVVQNGDYQVRGEIYFYTMRTPGSVLCPN